MRMVSLRYSTWSRPNNVDSSVQQSCYDDSALYSHYSRASHAVQEDGERQVVRAIYLSFGTVPHFDRSKPPIQTAKQQQLQRVIHSYIQNVLHLVEQSPDRDTILLACKETAKVVPYFAGSRKTVKIFLKVCDVTCYITTYSHISTGNVGIVVQCRR